MKLNLIFSFIILLAFNSSLATVAKGGKEKAVIQTSAICESCQNRIETALNKLSGVKSASLNLDDKKVTVVYNPKKITVEDIKKAISEAGYDADDVNANQGAYNKLPGCCKKGGHDH